MDETTVTAEQTPEQTPAQTAEKTAEQASNDPVKKPDRNFMDALRDRWDGIAYRSTAGSWGLRLLLALLVLLSLQAAVRFGLAERGSLLNDFLRFLAKYFPAVEYLLMGIGALLAVIWLFSPMLGSLLCAGMLYVCYASVSPTVLMIAMLLFLMFLPEERTVLALMLALPVLCFSTELPLGLFLVVWAAFASTRTNNGTVKTLSFVYYALLELCRGSFGVVVNKAGWQVLPAPDNALYVSTQLRRAYTLWAAGKGFEGLFVKLLIPLILFFLVGLVFAKLLNLRSKQRKLSVDVLDGICFAVLAALLCALPIVLPVVSELGEFCCGVPALLVQILAAYVVTRPIAGPSPERGNLPARAHKHYIFISYAHLDLSLVKPCLDILEERDYAFWYDKSIATGAAWRDVIAGNISRCTCFFAFVSQTSLRSDYCLKELNYAISKKKPIALILLDDTPLPPTIEMFLASMQCVHRYRLPGDKACMDMALRLEGADLCRREQP